MIFEQFRCHEYEGGLKLYTESVICAPEFGPELSLAFGNRSACLYHLGHYKDCLQDIELAFRFRFPKNLAYKLHQRRGQCQTKLGLFKVNHCVLLFMKRGSNQSLICV